MPRTKQNNPKNLKDKIEEAQKELKDPKASQKGVAENSRSADGIKGLKRKKVVAESQLKKIPKSPVKKPSQAKTQVAKDSTLSFGSSTFRNKPTVSNQNGEPEENTQALHHPPKGQSVRAEATTTAPGCDRPIQTEARGAQQQSFKSCNEEGGPAHGIRCSLEDNWGSTADSNSATASHSTAPLEVLLKAMEPDLCSLAERNSSFPARPTLTEKATVAMPAINVAVPAQLTLTAPDFSNRQQQYYQSVPQAVPLSSLAASQTTTLQYQHSQAPPPGQMHELVHSGSLHAEKQGLHQSYSTVPASILTHAPAPSGHKVLPQSQPAVQTCQSISASVPSAIQVPVTPGYHQVQMATIVTPGLEQMCSSSAKDQKNKKQGKYVCEYCSRACAKPSVLLKHIRSHTGERPYPCVTCGFSFKTKSNLYKHKKSHAHAIKLGLVVRSDSGGGTLSQESDRTPSAHSDVEESGESEDESAADLDPDSSQSSVTRLSESSLQIASTAHTSQEEAETPATLETLKVTTNQKALEPKVTASLPKVVVYSVNVSPLRADSPRATDSTQELAQTQKQHESQATAVRSNITVLSSLTEVSCPSPLQDIISEDEDQHCKSPTSGGHALLQRQEATDFSLLQRQQATDAYQQQQGKGLLSPRSLGSTDSGYFSRSESADQAMSPPSPFVKITPPTDMDVSKNLQISHSTVVTTIMQATQVEKPPALQGQMRPPLQTKTLSLEERISKLISDNEAVVDNKQLDSVKPRRTSLSRRGSIDSPKSYIFKDSFQFDLKPIGRRSSSSSDIPKSPFTPTDKSKQVFLLSVPPQYPSMDCLPITRSNSMPTTPGSSAIPPNVSPQPHVLRGCQSFDDKISSLNDDVFISAPSTPNPAVHPRTLVRQIAIEDSCTTEGHGFQSTRSMDEGRLGPNISTEIVQRSKSFEPELNKKSQQGKGTMFECETCRNRYRKLENFENHKKFYCSELHGPKNKPVSVREVDQDVFLRSIQQSSQAFHQRPIGNSGVVEQQTSVRKRRKMKSVGDDDDQSPTETNPPCSGSFDSCQLSKDVQTRTFSLTSLTMELQSTSSQPQISPIQLMGRSTESSECRLSPIREAQISVSAKERGELQRQGSGTSVIRHTNSLSRPNSFETSESIDRSSPVDLIEKEAQCINKTATAATINVTKDSQPESAPLQKCMESEMPGKDHHTNCTVAMPSESAAPAQQSRLVRQNNIQVPEILVTEEPDREQEIQGGELEKPLETFSWPQRSESLSKLPTEKLPPKKKRIRLAEMEHSSGESSFESTLSRSLSRDSSLSRCSSISASFDRDELPRADSPSRAECPTRSIESQCLPLAGNMLGVPGLRDSREMRRASSEQISCTQPSLEISSEYRSKSFDCGSVSPSRSTSPIETTMPKSPQAAPVAQIPLIERRRGPLVRQMSLKIGFENPLPSGKHPVAFQKMPTANIVLAPQQRFQTTSLPSIGKPLILHQVSSGEAVQQKNEVTVQSINLGSQTQHAQVHGLPHPWYQTSKTLVCQRTLQAPVQAARGQDSLNNSADLQDMINFVPKYQLQCSSPKASTYISSNKIGTQITMPPQITSPVISLPVAKEINSISKPTGGIQNICVVPHSHQIAASPAAPIALPAALQGRTCMPPLPQILITHEVNPPSSAVPCSRPLPMHVTDNSIKHSHMHAEDPQSRSSSSPDHQRCSMPSMGSLHCVQKMSSMGLCPQQEPTASSKRMLSPANSLDIAMEKHQKRAKDEHGAACLTDGRSLSYLNTKMAEVTRQRKLTLVRQVCTTEPVDSPIETEAPQQHPEKTEADKIETADTQTPDNSKNRLNPNAGHMVESETPAAVPYQDTSGPATSPVPVNSMLKSFGKCEDGRSTAKSPVRTPSVQGHGKLASSVSVVNTRDSHRLSFPSLKTATTLTWCYLMKRKPLHVFQTDQKISAYSTWSVSTNNPNPLGLPTKVVMSLFNSKQTAKKTHYTQAITTSLKSDILSYSSKLKDSLPKVITPQTSKSNEKCKLNPDTQLSNELDRDSSSSKSEPRRVKIFDGGYKSNEEYVYVRGRGRGKYICEECGIRCKKPSMLRKHIRTHSDVRPYHCTHCNFSFKTKGNLTKHMKSKAHSKKCMEMGVSLNSVDDQDTEDTGERSQMGSTDRPGSDGEDSDGAEDEDNDLEDEDEEDSQAESGLSTTPSVSASPQHLPAMPLDALPSALLAQMSISEADPSPGPAPLSLSQPPASDTQASDTESVTMMSPVMVVSPGPASLSFPPPPTSELPNRLEPLSFPSPPITDSHSSDTESVTMMSPVSPCRQMSIDYPDIDGPTTPPVPGKCSKNTLNSPPPLQTSETGLPVDRSTQTTLLPPSAYDPPGSLRFLPQTQIQGPNVGTHTHLFSHLPLHSQQPPRSPYSMVPVGGIQLVPAGLAAYSTFLPVQAGPVQLTIPAVSVLHRSSSPLPSTNLSPRCDAPVPAQHAGVAEPVSGVLPCFPLGQVSVAGLQPLGGPQPLQQLGLEALSVVGVANASLPSTQLLPQPGLTLKTLGLQVLAASPASQGMPSPQAHVPGLQILNIALPTLIPSLSPLSAAPSTPPAPPVPTAQPSHTEAPGSCASAIPPIISSTPTPPQPAPAVHVSQEVTPHSTPCVGSAIGHSAGSVEQEEVTSPPQPFTSPVESAPTGGAPVKEPQKRQAFAKRPVTVEYNDVSSDDEDRLVIAT